MAWSLSRKKFLMLVGIRAEEGRFLWLNVNSVSLRRAKAARRYSRQHEHETGGSGNYHMFVFFRAFYLILQGESTTCAPMVSISMPPYHSSLLPSVTNFPEHTALLLTER